MTEQKDWSRLEDAARIAAVAQEKMRQWAQGVDPNGHYMPNGYPPTGEEGETTVTGAECVRVESNGEILLTDAVVQGWKDAQEHEEKLRKQGWKSPNEIAEEAGISEEEVLERFTQWEQNRRTRKTRAERTAPVTRKYECQRGIECDAPSRAEGSPL